ncbi:hypothetical protein BDK51DRAFT_27224 [Blyttiomyces helicus]|uniref:Uncharacterized protein n=1 Tax=Blyttiomyces helicus TaxID=388810 RepID=A0A4P9W8V0_9FUNG|nr:hypothetical protein BDK51DRAFT_27224 [Blyttiomyces helicus]|eukprot:RKO87518.1 hypothetical protein BDK51DRAFT_27224 [Blyttiomyces helicus]
MGAEHSTPQKHKERELSSTIPDRDEPDNDDNDDYWTMPEPKVPLNVQTARTSSSPSAQTPLSPATLKSLSTLPLTSSWSASEYDALAADPFRPSLLSISVDSVKSRGCDSTSLAFGLRGKKVVTRAREGRDGHHGTQAAFLVTFHSHSFDSVKLDVYDGKKCKVAPKTHKNNASHRGRVHIRLSEFEDWHTGVYTKSYPLQLPHQTKPSGIVELTLTFTPLFDLDQAADSPPSSVIESPTSESPTPLDVTPSSTDSDSTSVVPSVSPSTAASSHAIDLARRHTILRAGVVSTLSRTYSTTGILNSPTAPPRSVTTPPDPTNRDPAQTPSLAHPRKRERQLRRNRRALLRRLQKRLAVTDPDAIALGLRFWDYSMATYGSGPLMFFGHGSALDLFKFKSDVKAACHHLGLERKDILVWEYSRKAICKPRFFIAHDKKLDAIVISIQGTIHTAQVLTDVNSEFFPFKDGYTHMGILRCAQWIMENYGMKLKEFVKERGVSSVLDFRTMLAEAATLKLNKSLTDEERFARLALKRAELKRAAEEGETPRLLLAGEVFCLFTSKPSEGEGDLPPHGVMEHDTREEYDCIVSRKGFVMDHMPWEYDAAFRRALEWVRDPDAVIAKASRGKKSKKGEGARAVEKAVPVVVQMEDEGEGVERAAPEGEVEAVGPVVAVAAEGAAVAETVDVDVGVEVTHTVAADVVDDVQTTLAMAALAADPVEEAPLASEPVDNVPLAADPVSTPFSPPETADVSSLLSESTVPAESVLEVNPIPDAATGTHQD